MREGRRRESRREGGGMGESVGEWRESGTESAGEGEWGRDSEEGGWRGRERERV